MGRLFNALGGITRGVEAGTVSFNNMTVLVFSVTTLPAVAVPSFGGKGESSLKYAQEVKLRRRGANLEVTCFGDGPSCGLCLHGLGEQSTYGTGCDGHGIGGATR